MEMFLEAIKPVRSFKLLLESKVLELNFIVRSTEHWRAIQECTAYWVIRKRFDAIPRKEDISRKVKIFRALFHDPNMILTRTFILFTWTLSAMFLVLIRILSFFCGYRSTCYRIIFPWIVNIHKDLCLVCLVACASNGRFILGKARYASRRLQEGFHQRAWHSVLDLIWLSWRRLHCCGRWFLGLLSIRECITMCRADAIVTNLFLETSCLSTQTAPLSKWAYSA